MKYTVVRLAPPTPIYYKMLHELHNCLIENTCFVFYASQSFVYGAVINGIYYLPYRFQYSALISYQSIRITQLVDLSDVDLIFTYDLFFAGLMAAELVWSSITFCTITSQSNG